MERAQKIEDGIRRVGQRGNVVFTEFGKRQKDAREASQALGYVLGQNIPQSLEKILVKVPLVAKGLSPIGNVASFVALGVGISALITNLDSLEKKFYVLRDTAFDAGQRTLNFLSAIPSIPVAADAVAERAI